MKKYIIEISYRTGNTFGSEDIIEGLGYSWDNLDIVKENLKRIKLHHEWYINKSVHYASTNRRKIRKPKFVLKKWNTGIILLNDDGIEMDAIHTFWCGYFETLYYAEIKVSKDPELIYVTDAGKEIC